MLESRKSSFSRPAGKSPILNKMAVFVLVKQGCTFAMRSSLYCENCDSEANSLRRKFKGVRFAFASLFEGPNSQKSENFCRILAFFNKNSFERARVRAQREFLPCETKSLKGGSRRQFPPSARDVPWRIIRL